MSNIVPTQRALVAGLITLLLALTIVLILRDRENEVVTGAIQGHGASGAPSAAEVSAVDIDGARTAVEQPVTEALQVLDFTSHAPIQGAAVYSESGKMAGSGSYGQIPIEGMANQLASCRVFALGYLPSEILVGAERVVYLKEDPGVLARATQIGVEAQVTRTIPESRRAELDAVELKILEEIDAMEFEVSDSGEVLVPGWPTDRYILLRQVGPGESVYSTEVEPCLGKAPYRRYTRFREFGRNSQVEFWMYQFDGSPAEGLAVDVKGQVDWKQRAIVEKDGRVAVDLIPSGGYVEVWADVTQDWRYYDTVWLKDPTKRVSRMSVRDFSVNVLAPPEGLELEVASAADSHPEVTDRLVGSYPGPDQLTWIPVHSEGLTPITAGIFGEGTCALIRDAAREQPLLTVRVVPGQMPEFDLSDYGALKIELNERPTTVEWHYTVAPVQDTNAHGSSVASIDPASRRKIKGSASEQSVVRALLAGLYTVSIQESNGRLLDAGQVRIEPGQLTVHEVILPAPVELVVRVVTPLGTPIPGAFVELLASADQSARPAARFETDESGWCRQTVPNFMPFVRAASAEPRRTSRHNRLVLPARGPATSLVAGSEITLQLDIAWIRVHSVPRIAGWRESEEPQLSIRPASGEGSMSFRMANRSEHLLPVRPGIYKINLYSTAPDLFTADANMQIDARAGEVVDFNVSERFPRGLSCVYFEAIASERGEPRRVLKIHRGGGDAILTRRFEGAPERITREAIYLPAGLQLDVGITTYREEPEQVLARTSLTTTAGKEVNLLVETHLGEVVQLRIRE